MKRCAFVLLLCATACARGEVVVASATHEPQATAVLSPVFFGRQLAGHEISALIVGRTISHDVSRARSEGLAAITTPYEERYRPDGLVSIVLDRAGMAGRYEIIDDQLCVIMSDGQECRLLLEAPDGLLVQKDVKSSEITPIVIK